MRNLKFKVATQTDVYLDEIKNDKFRVLIVDSNNRPKTLYNGKSKNQAKQIYYKYN